MNIMKLATVHSYDFDPENGSMITVCEPCIRAESWLYDDVDAIDYDAPHGRCAYCEKSAEDAA